MTHTHIGFVGPRPRSLADIYATVFDGDELPLSASAVKSLRHLIAKGICIRVHAKTAADLDRCCMAIALATGLLPCQGQA